MSEVVQIFLVLTIFLGYLAFLSVVVIINPNKLKAKAKKENDEICIELDSDEKKKS